MKERMPTLTFSKTREKVWSVEVFIYNGVITTYNVAFHIPGKNVEQSLGEILNWNILENMENPNTCILHCISLYLHCIVYFLTPAPTLCGAEISKGLHL